jgi:peptidoglycan/xylan/chitin deacetylase (PgdA/CDA1 family)
VDELMKGRHRLTRALKVVIAHGLYYVGLLQLWQRVALRRKAVVLMYHRVLTAEERRRTGSHPGIVVDRKTFARQMAVLKRRFTVLSLSEFARRMEDGIPFPDSACLITFDDGWQDNFQNGLAVLREHGLPALVFLPVNYIGSRRLFWREALTHLLVELVQKVRVNPALGPHYEALLEPLGLERVLDAAGDDPRPSVVEAMASHGALRAADAEPLLTKLHAELGLNVDARRTPDTFIDWDQAELMSHAGIAFGGHGVEHRLLTDISPDAAAAEIDGALDVIHRKLNGAVPVPTFSYPNGNWNRELAAKVKASGYRLAFTTVPGRISCHDDCFTLKRVNIHETATDSTPMFLARIVGLF